MAKPDWLKIRPPVGGKFEAIGKRVQELGLHTVCQGAHCPNMSECWSAGTATFLVMGDTCTRGCRFCAVKKGAKGQELDGDEPRRLAQAAREFGLKYVVITSVDRDDLPDGGAGHFAECVRAVKKSGPKVLVEVLIPDFGGSEAALRTVVDAEPDVVAHNIETTRELQKVVRDARADYEQSLEVLEKVKKMDAEIYTKSSLMLGVGEREEDVEAAMDDLRAVDCDILVMGQYLRPTEMQMPVKEFVTLEKFERLKKLAEAKGFLAAESSPFARTSYRAGEVFIKAAIENKGKNSEVNAHD
ncbi:MAG: lipoyl synthase [Candidatus Burarchaeum sp.]|nr:lipoyl synthase [Candidatus Burarchaeum sp.]MDO8340077.1 lipoyl synthase [Candidatus Burarchaeum sp.]